MDFEDAVALAARAHHGQVDKEDVVYLLHPLRVALAVSERARNAAVLHDVVEDTDTTLDDLEAAGLSPAELEAVELLARRSEDTYAEFIDRVGGGEGEAGEIAREVKLADVEDNLRQMPSFDTPEWNERRERYERALPVLRAATNS